MAMELYDSQYLLILAPSVVIALMFLFFWLFMKETSYDEVLARQKRDLKLPPAKPETRKKNDKKKSKKKEVGAGGGGSSGGGGGESEEDPREFDLTDAVEEEPPPPVPAPPEPSSGLRERKKKEKRQAKAEDQGPARQVNGSKPAARRSEPPFPVTKQLSPPAPAPAPAPPPPVEPAGKKKGSVKKQRGELDELQLETRVDQAPPLVKKEASVVIDTTKVQDSPTPTTGSGKKRNSAKKQKTEPALVDEQPIQPSVYIPLMDSDPAVGGNPQKGYAEDAPAKVNAKKLKNDTDKENSEVKLKEFLAGLRSLALSEEEAVTVAAVLREKSPSALDAWHRSTAKTEPSAQQIQEKERILTLQEEASIAKEKVKQLSQELQGEKQKTGRAEAMLREQRGAMEEQLSVMQAKAQGSYQELQSMQMKFQQMRETLETKIARLQQENSILMEAVSTATNQMESKQTSELNQLRSECAGLMKELAESSGKLQQEELQRKTLEANYSQLEAQLQDAKRRWEELQNFLHSVNAEREKLQAAKQELQSQLLAVESEMSGKHKEIQTLHSSLTDMMVSKDQMEQKVMQLLEVSQRSLSDESMQDLLNENKALQLQIENLQTQINSQTTTTSHFEELQKLLADKELQRKSLEDSLNAERSSGASRETDMQAIHTENLMLKAELQKLQVQLSEQASSQLVLEQFQTSALEKDEKMKTVEMLLEAGLIQVANKEEELKELREENDTLKRELEVMRKTTTEQTSSESLLEELQKAGFREPASVDPVGLAESASECESDPCEDSFPTTDDEDLELLYKFRTDVQPVGCKTLASSGEGSEESDKEQNASDGAQEKEEKMKVVEEKLQAELETAFNKDQTMKALQQQVEALRAEMEQTRQREAEEANAAAQLQQLQSLLAVREQELQALQGAVEERTNEGAEMERRLQALQEEGNLLRSQLDLQQAKKEDVSQELLSALAEKDKQVSELESELATLRDSLELQRKKNNELREKNWSAMEALAATESMLQGKLGRTAKESRSAVESVEAECREVLHRILPHVALPTVQNHQDWLRRFQSAAEEFSAAAPARETDHAKVGELEGKLKESDEAQKVLQKDCETYKKVLAETEGILQRLQSSVEQEESRWRLKLEVSQEELREMNLKVALLESEVDRLNSESTELENLRREKLHLESELERAEREVVTYVLEARELKDLLTELQSKLDGSYTEAVRQNGELNLLKTQLAETMYKLEAENDERQKVAGDLYKAQQSLDWIQAEILKEAGQVDLIENSSIATQKEEIDRKEKMTAGLNQTVRELQQLLQAVNRQLTKRQEVDVGK